jgi:hypothetical protein
MPRVGKSKGNPEVTATLSGSGIKAHTAGPRQDSRVRFPSPADHWTEQGRRPSSLFQLNCPRLASGKLLILKVRLLLQLGLEFYRDSLADLRSRLGVRSA